MQTKKVKRVRKLWRRNCFTEQTDTEGKRAGLECREENQPEVERQPPRQRMAMSTWEGQKQGRTEDAAQATTRGHGQLEISKDLSGAGTSHFLWPSVRKQPSDNYCFQKWEETTLEGHSKREWANYDAFKVNVLPLIFKRFYIRVKIKSHRKSNDINVQRKMRPTEV